MPLFNSSHFIFVPATKESIQQLTVGRNGETKIGEHISFGKPTKNSKFVLLGIEESAGPLANNGIEGAENGFSAFFKRFLNMQSNRFLQGNEIAFIGSIQQNSVKKEQVIQSNTIEELDDFVEKILSDYLADGIIPIVIGGGHNNAYPLIKALSKFNKSSIDVVNLDPHADCRALEGRHSGNPFSYANAAGFINQYTVLGLHKAYNSEYLLNYLDAQEFTYSFFDDYIGNSSQFYSDIHKTFENLSPTKKFGIELDLDAIQFMPSSAFTPSGITLENARFYIQSLAKHPNCCYLHLPEGAPTTILEEKIVGKALAYLVYDFLTTQNKI